MALRDVPLATSISLTIYNYEFNKFFGWIFAPFRIGNSRIIYGIKSNSATLYSETSVYTQPSVFSDE